MKKTRAILLTIILITITFASCNLDGSAGIFRQLSQAKEPLSIRYKQLLGKYATHLYFTTEDGIERVTSPANKTTVVASKYENIVRSAALYSTGDILYRTNNVTEQAENKINIVNVSTSPFTPLPQIVPDPTNIPTIQKIKLLPNSMLLVFGEDTFEIQEYNGSIFNPIPNSPTTLSGTGFGLHAVIQQTGKEQDNTVPMIVSFAKVVNEDVSYVHYVVDTSGTNAPIPLIGFGDKTIANFVYNSTNENVYVLTTDGTLYYAGTLTGPLQKVAMKSGSSTYRANSFAYAIHNSSNFHLITKPSAKTSPLQVFSFPDTAIDGTGTTLTKVESGYAKELSLTNIMSTLVKSSDGPETELYVATDVNGMFEITITDANANVNSAANGSTKGAEEYTF
jgi:hypothetical protein